MKEEHKMTKVVQVRFKENSYKDYSFKTDLDLEVGDKVICDCSTGIAIATVVSTHEESYNNATRWVIQKVDLTEHQRRIDREKALAKLENEMAKRAKELTNITQYQILAKDDMVMKGLLCRYEYLLNGGEVNV